MFLSKEDPQEGLDGLLVKMKKFRKDLEKLLDNVGMNRSEFDQFIKDPSHFSGPDWQRICQEIDEFKKTIDLISFSSGKEELEKKREELKAQSQWMRKRHPN
jgi:hypothetical protein